MGQTKKKLRIFIVTAYPTQGAGSGTLITAQAKTYVEMGYEVHIITANNNTDFAKLEGVTYHLVPFTAEKEPIEHIEGALPFNFVMFTSHTNSSENFWNITLDQLHMYCNKFKEVFDKTFEEFQPDIIHGQHCWISTGLLTDYDYPVITTIHGTDLMGYERARETLGKLEQRIRMGECTSELFAEKAKCEFYMAMSEKAAMKSQEIFVISNQQKKKFCELFPYAAEKVKLVRNGCDTTVYHKESIDATEVLSELKSNVTPDGKIPMDFDHLALFVGKFAGFKRVDLVIDAAKIYEEEMAKQGKKVLTIIAGSGALDAELREHQKQVGTQNTHFVGRIGPDTVRALNNIADVFIAPSDDEPDGLVYKECMLCGNIPIGTLGGGVPDTINPENLELTTVVPGSSVFKTPYGILVPMGNARAVADAAMYVFNHENEFSREDIIAYASANYDQRSISKNVIIPTFEHFKQLGILLRKMRSELES